MSHEKLTESDRCEAIVIGASAGGHTALGKILPCFAKTFPLPIILVTHINKHADQSRLEVLTEQSQLPVVEAADKKPIKPGVIYVAPPDYHLLIESERTFSLSREDPVNFCRPAIDVLFETAAEVYANRLVGVLLSGANQDGAEGMHVINLHGGTTVVQDPASAEVDFMPQCAINRTRIDHILPLNEIGPFLAKLGSA